jgi:hypothetical protein
MQTFYRILVRLGVVAALPSLVLLVVGGVSYFNAQRAVAKDSVPVADCRDDQPWRCYAPSSSAPGNYFDRFDAVVEPSSYETPLGFSAGLATIPALLWLLAWVVKPVQRRSES